MQRRIFSGLAALCLAAATFGAPVISPISGNSAQAQSTSTASLNISPLGANDWNCEPSAKHPRPVVLVHGTFETMADNWLTLSPTLKAQGYCVYALNYGLESGLPGTGDIRKSAAQLGDFVDKVRAASGASKVDMVGHSQGGMMPRWYMGHLGGAKYVNDFVAISPSSHGTQGVIVPSSTGMTLINVVGAVACDACMDQVAGSEFLTELNSIGDTVKGPDYTVIATKYDEVVTPYRSQFLDGPPEHVTNILIQDKCPLDLSGHVGINHDPVMHRLVLNALSTEGPADRAYRPSCTI
ncbi:esterase/lipase family protein [Glutamicibacter mishrai]|uniref:Alpha/beta fold hydrolase n=1 Tax=Glutamicibacter mishrai TaxID=1775880 RepID=A0A6H0SJZ0_9MICC|nr:alpha/beta fold hydrolase [Glutamicibacter mishrai]QIV87490.1 alpha/beta fold hydrolase [Glutamicibacter mishrai]